MFTKFSRILTAGALGVTLAASLAGVGHAASGDAWGNETVDGSSVTVQHTSSSIAAGESDFDAFLASLIEDSANYWSGRFSEGAQQGHNNQWQQLTYVIIDGDETVTACANPDTGTMTTFGDRHDYDRPVPLAYEPAAFCPWEMTVYLSSQWLYNKIYAAPASADGDYNDFGVAFVVAHEVAHAVQTQLVITAPVGSRTVSPTELQADCLAGVWGNSKYYGNVLDGNDVEQGVETAARLGEHLETTVHHGTPEERSYAFMTGYNSGDISQCTLQLPGAY